MKWTVEHNKYDYIKDVINAILTDINEDRFNQYIDELYGQIDICGLFYDTSEVLKAVDPIAYRCLMADWESEISRELSDEINAMDPGETAIINRHFVECIDEDLINFERGVAYGTGIYD